MANVNANVNIVFNAQQASAELRRLSSEISAFNKQNFAANSAASQQQRALNQALIDGVKTSGHFRTSIVPLTSAVENFSNSIEKGKLTLGQYTRYAASQLPGMRKIFTREFDMIQRVAEDRVKKLNTQFVSLGESANGMQRALAMTPTSLDQFSARSAIALQRQQLFNRLLRDGSTQLLNWGKNTQWAGRQLMVGFTIPLGLLGAQAAKVFRELEAEAVNFKKVYGDMFTTDVEVEQNLAAVKELAAEMTKYGQTVQQTMQLANTAAQSGQRGAELLAATTQATRLAVLGQMEQNQAIETTISLQTAFALSNEELAQSINFLNSVENQTILSLQDVSEAIPRVASVVKGFGGNVEDLAVLLVAMKEGGVSAAEGSNALKNSLARIVAPTKQALDVSARYGIALREIVNRNEGRIVPLFQELSQALDAVGGQPRQEILSAIFGKFQYARIGTLLSNIARDGSQAATAIELTGMEARDLALTAEKELGAVEDAVSTKFTAAMEKAKLALAPVGEEFLKALTPVLNTVGSILDKFNELPGGLKTAIVAAIGIIGGIAPIVLMVTGLVANGIANIAKFILFLRKQIGILRGNGEQFKMYSSAELEAAAAAASLEGKTTSLTRSMLLQRPAIETLITLYQRLATSAATAAAAMPATMGPMGRAALPAARGGAMTAVVAQTRNMGGPIFATNGRTVPGVGNTDTVPAMLTPGEFVINKKATQQNLPLIKAINSGDVDMRQSGGSIGMASGIQYANVGLLLQGMKRVSKLTSPQNSMGKVFPKWFYDTSTGTNRSRQRKALEDSLELGIQFKRKDGSELPIRRVSDLSDEDVKGIWKGVHRGHIAPSTPMGGGRDYLPGILAPMLGGGKGGNLSQISGGKPKEIFDMFSQLESRGIHPMSLLYGAAKDLGYKASPSMFTRAYDDLMSGLLSRRTSFSSLESFESWAFKIMKRNLGGINNESGNFLERMTRVGTVRGVDPRRTKSDSGVYKQGRGSLFAGILPGFNQGGAIGMGSGRVPAMLTPGEFVVNKNASQSNLPLLEAINSGNVAGFNMGGMIPGVQYLYGGAAVAGAKAAQSQTMYRMGRHPFGKYSIDKNMNKRAAWGKWAGKGLYFAQNINETKKYKYQTLLGKAFPKVGDFLSKIGLERRMWKTTLPTARILDLDEQVVQSYTRNSAVADRIRSGMTKAMAKNGVSPSVLPSELPSTPRGIRDEFITSVSMALRNKRGYSRSAKKRKAKAEDMWLQALRGAGYDAIRNPGGLSRVGAPSDEFVLIRRPKTLKRVREKERRRIASQHAQAWNSGGMIPKYGIGGKVAKSMIKANKGLNTVPGMGNRDTVPALLTPGEAVINKEATKQYKPLIEAINAGNVGQFNQGTPQSMGKAPFVHLMSPTTLSNAMSDMIRKLSGNSAIQKTTGRLTGYSNFGAYLPQAANEGKMSPSELRRLFQDRKQVDRIMRPMYKAVALQMYGSDNAKAVARVMKDPEVKKQVRATAYRWGESIGKITTSMVSDKQLYKAIRKTSTKDLPVVQRAINAMRVPTRVGAVGGRANIPVDIQRKIMPGLSRMGGGLTSYSADYRNRPTIGMPTAANPFANATSAQQLAREIRRNNPKLNSAQALNLARLQLRRANAPAGGGGGGGRTPTFLGMPGMPSGKPQSRFGRLNSGIGRAGMGLGMGVSMMGMLPMMNADEEGKWMGMSASSAMMGMMGAGTLLSLLPMLGAAAAPVAGVAAAAAAVGIGLYKWRDSVDSAARETAEFGSNLGVAANAASNMASILQIPDLLQSRQYQQLTVLPGEEEAFASFTQMLNQEGGAGQRFIKELKTATSEERFSKLTDYLRSGIAADLLTVEEAKLFAKAVGAELGDVILGIRAGAEITGQKTGSDALMEIAREREAAALDQPAILKTIESITRDSLDVSEAAMTVGAGSQIIKSYNEAIAKAQEDYENGTLSFNQLIDTVNDANSSIRTWESNIKTAYENVNDFGALLQGTNTALALSGVTPEQQKAIDDAYKALYQGAGSQTTAGALRDFVTAEGEKLPQLQTEAAFQRVAELAAKAGFDKNIQGVGAYIQSEFFDREAFDNILQFGKNLETVMKSDLLQVATKQAVIERGIDPLQAVSMMNTIASDETALQAFIDGGQTVDAFMNAIVSANAEIMFSSQKLQDSFVSLSGQLDKTGQSEAFRAYLAGAANDSERAVRLREIESVGAGMDTQSALNARSRYLATKTVAGQFFDEATIASIQQSAAYQSALNARRTETRTLPRSGAKVSREVFDDREITEINEAIGRAGEAGVAGEIVEYAIQISVEGEEDASSTIDQFTEKVQNLQGLDEEVRIALGIDLNNGEDVSTFGGFAEEILRSWGMLSALNPNIDLSIVARSAILDEEGKVIDDPTKVAKNIMAINKAYTDLEKASGKQKKKAQVDLVKQYQTKTEVVNENGETVEVLKPQDIVNDANKTLNEIGKDIDKLPAAQASQVLQIQTALSDALAEKRAEMYQLMADEKKAVLNQDYEAASMISQQIATKQKEMASLEADAKANILSIGMQKSGSTGGGGGGGSESPVKAFVQDILNQVKLWTDASAKISDLNNAKNSFVNQVLKGQGIFDKIKNVKGLPQSVIDQIMGMGPKGASEFIKKYVTKGGDLTKAGRALMNAASAARINQTIGMNFLGAETARMQTRASRRLRRRGESQEVIDAISGDPTSAADFLKLQRAADRGIPGAQKKLNQYLKSQREIVAAVKAEEEARMSVSDQISKQYEDMMKPLKAEEAAFQYAFGEIDRYYAPQIRASEKIIKGLEEQIDLVNEEIEALQRLNDADQQRIRGLERQKEMLQRQIEVIERQNELDQREIDRLSRQDEMRTRVSDSISRDLDMMSQQEEKIREAYDERIKALDKVAALNEYITQQQQKQVNLSQAIAQGDVYAAASAMQDMSAGSAQFAQQQLRAGMEEGMNQSIENLRTSEGLTREQAEERIRQIEEQSYQTNLKIQVIQDRIYDRNLQLIPLKDQQRALDEQIRVIQDAIFNRETEIIGIQNSRLQPLQQSLEKEQKRLTSIERQVDEEKNKITINGKNYDQLMDQIGAQEDLYNYTLAQIDALEATDKRVVSIANNWKEVSKQINEANKAAMDASYLAKEVANARVADINFSEQQGLLSKQEAEAQRKAAQETLDATLKQVEDNRQASIDAARGTTEAAVGALGVVRAYAGGKIKKYAMGGSVPGVGGRDSVSSMLTPGEYVIRKSMVNKYGTPFFDAINMGAFKMPRYDIASSPEIYPTTVSSSTTAISAPVYNSYDMKFMINGTNSSADEIANKVMFKMKQLSSRDIRSNRA